VGSVRVLWSLRCALPLTPPPLRKAR
jgi:hypothetical protein